MARQTLGLADDVHQYLLTVGLRDNPLLRRLREETAEATGGNADMQISAEQGAFMHLLTKLTNVRRALEVGTFTGFSSLCVATALPTDGRMICCDRSDEWTQIARRYWQEAGVADKIELRLGDGIELFRGLIDEGAAGSFDLVFLDADKDRLPDYYELSLDLLRPGGVVLGDNALRGGKVADPEQVAANASTRAIDQLNRRMQADERIDWCLLPIGDGVAMGRKRE